MIRQWSTPACVLACGALLSLLCWQAARNSEEQAAAQVFRSRAEEHLSLITSQFESAVDDLAAVRAFFAASQHVDCDEFNTFASHLLSRNAGLKAMHWVPLVSADGRSAHEQTQQDDLPGTRIILPSYRIMQPSDDCGAAATSARGYLQPNAYSISLDGDQAPDGLDLAERADIRRLFDEVSTTGDISILRQSISNVAPDALDVVVPLYREDREHARQKGELEGFVIGSLSLGEIVETALSRLSPGGVDITLADQIGGGRALYHHDSRRRNESSRGTEAASEPSPHRMSAQIQLAGRTFLVRCSAAPTLVEQEATQWPIAALLAGLIFSVLLASFVASVGRNHAVLQKRVEYRTAELAHSEQRFRHLFQSSRDAITVLAEGAFVDANQAALELFGCASLDAFCGRSLAEFSPPLQPSGEASEELAQQRIAKALQEGSHFFEWVHRRADGSLFAAEVFLSRMESLGAGVLQATVRNITERKDAEASLALQNGIVRLVAKVGVTLAKEKYLRSGLQECCQAICEELGAAFARIWTLDATGQMLDLQASVGQYTHINGGHAHVPVGQYKIGRIAASGKPHLTNDVPNDPNIGDPQWARREKMVAFAGYPLIVGGQVIGVIALFSRQQLSQATLDGLAAIADTVALFVERMRNEQALQDSEEKFQQLASHLHDILWMTTADGEKVIYVSPAYESIWGRPCQALYQRPADWADGLHPDDRDRVMQAINERTAEDGYKETFRVVRPDGSIRWVHACGYPIRNADGEVYRIAGILRDVTERQQLDEDLRTAKDAAEAASLAKSQFLARTSHELRTPLNGVIGMTELLQHTELDDRQRRFVEACHSSGKSLLTLINDILDFAKIEAGKLELEDEEFELEHLVEETVEVMSFQASEKGLDLFARVSSQLPARVIGDCVRLRQILVNLIGNAIKFTDHGEINIRVVSLENGRTGLVRFEVADSGVGIESDKIQRLFESFTQADSSTSRKYGGTGLGLTICKHLVEMMGGEIGVESELGGGSNFWFEIPLKRAADRSRIDRETPLHHRRAVLLIVSPGVRQFVTDTLGDWKMVVEGASSMEATLHKLRAARESGQPCDLVVVEEQALSPSALANFAQAVKGDPALSRAKLLLISGQGSNLTREQIPEVDGLVRTPLCQSALLNTINECLIEHPLVPGSAKKHAGFQDQIAVPGLRVLLAEDNSTNQLFASEVLRHAGLYCDCVANGAEALLAVKRKSYDLILMDCQMPEMDGFEATQSIRQMERDGELAGHLPIIALTANAVKGDRERCQQAGMDDYLSKPFEPRQLLGLIARMFTSDSVETASEDVVQRQAAKPPKPSDPLPVDYEQLLARCMGKSAFAQELLNDFEGELPDLVETVSRRVAGGDLAGAGEAAHSLKGSAGIVGAEAVRRVAADIEAAGKSGQLDYVPGLLNTLNAETARFLDALPTIRNELATSPVE